jgi:hypothetical protein
MTSRSKALVATLAVTLALAASAEAAFAFPVYRQTARAGSTPTLVGEVRWAATHGSAPQSAQSSQRLPTPPRRPSVDRLRATGAAHVGRIPRDSTRRLREARHGRYLVDLPKHVCPDRRRQARGQPLLGLSGDRVAGHSRRVRRHHLRSSRRRCRFPPAHRPWTGADASVIEPGWRRGAAVRAALRSGKRETWVFAWRDGKIMEGECQTVAEALQAVGL